MIKKNKIYLITLFIIISNDISSQKHAPSSGNNNSSITYGQIKSVNNNNIGSSPSLSFIGIDLQSAIVTNLARLYLGACHYDSHLSYNYIVPQKTNTPTSTHKTSGYKVNIIPFGFDLFYKKKNIDLIFATGFSFGRIKQSIDYINGTYSTFKNNFLLLEFSIQPRYVTKYLSFSVRPSYSYDFSTAKWQGQNNYNDKPTDTKLSLFGIQGAIGLTLFR